VISEYQRSVESINGTPLVLLGASQVGKWDSHFWLSAFHVL
jgi:hypothetical protein